MSGSEKFKDVLRGKEKFHSSLTGKKQISDNKYEDILKVSYRLEIKT